MVQLLLVLGLMGAGLARAQPAPPPDADLSDPTQAAPATPAAEVPGLLVVRMLLPPGVSSAALFLNGAFVAALPGGVLAAPLSLRPGGYYARVSAPGARSYDASLQVAAGQLIELTGVLQPETAAPPPLRGAAPASALVPSPRPSARRIGRKIVLGVVLGVIGVALTAGILTAAICGAGKCRSSKDLD